MRHSGDNVRVVGNGAARVVARRGGLIVLLVLLLAALFAPSHVAAAADQPFDPATQAETLRSALTQAQVAFSDPKAAADQLSKAQTVWTSTLAAPLRSATPEAAGRVDAAFADASATLAANNAPGFAAARAEVWTALLGASYAMVEKSLQANDGATARLWLPLREFRTMTRFSRPNADATIALSALVKGQSTADATLLAVRADLLDTYQARLDEALQDLPASVQHGFSSRTAEIAALANGYFAILAPAYGEQRGSAELTMAQAAFTSLRSAAAQGGDTTALLAAAQQAISGFRAAPLTAEDQLRRAGQLRRFMALVSVEYNRGVHDGVVLKDLEVQEAITFRDGAAAAFNDLRSIIDARDAANSAKIATQIDALGQTLAATASGQKVASPDAIQQATGDILKLLDSTMPSEWLVSDPAGDFDVIATVLDRMEAAVAAGQYPEAESARLEAYSILETGPEAKLTAFAPQLVLPIEDLFWYGQGDHKGLAFLISEKATLKEIQASRGALDEKLDEAVQQIAGNNAPEAVAANAGIIVFREGLEAVLILASLMGSLKRGANRRFRKPLWWGSGVAFVFTILTFMLARGVLAQFASMGERLEAIVSLIAIAVLLLITNWFFHKVYWTGWIANFHQQKKRLIGGEAGQMLGLVILGFTSIYREGFETVLFLQALVLESGIGTVLAGIGLGLAGVALIGVLVFAMQAKLPYKKMLVYTGVLIGAVLLVMVGNTTHILQVVGWLPLHPIAGLELPYWSGMWLGVYATWEGVILQIAAATFVIGSYFLAERQRDHAAEAEPDEAPARRKPAVVEKEPQTAAR